MFYRQFFPSVATCQDRPLSEKTSGYPRASITPGIPKPDASRARRRDLSSRPRTIVSIVPDLLTATRIAETARQLGVSHVSANARDAVEVCRRSSADLVIVDLESKVAPEPEAMILALKRDPATRAVPVLGFYAHVHNALRESALRAGADHVLPRSAFSRQLVRWLKGEPSQAD